MRIKQISLKTLLYIKSVSYTHLDVYKRQGFDIRTDVLTIDEIKEEVLNLSLIHI